MNDSNVTQFPIFNLTNIPEALRKVASDLEANPKLCTKLVLTGMNEAGGIWYKCFGPDLTKYQAVGMLEYSKLDIIGVLPSE